MEFDQPMHAKYAIEWFESKLNQTILSLDDLFSKFRISEALMEIYKLVWDDFCSWYLEMVKPGYEQPIDAKTLASTRSFFERLIQLLHPFMPFITEELWHALGQRADGNDIIISKWPEAIHPDHKVLDSMVEIFEVISGVRNFRKAQNIAHKVNLKLVVVSKKSNSLDAVLLKMGNLSEIKRQAERIEGAHCFMVRGIEYYIPFGELVDVEMERKKIEEEIAYTNGFLKSVQGKLSNDRFVSSAPAHVVEVERKKEADALQKLKTLQERLLSLK